MQIDKTHSKFIVNIYIPITTVVVSESCELVSMNVELVASLAVAVQVKTKVPAVDGVALYEEVLALLNNMAVVVLVKSVPSVPEKSTLNVTMVSTDVSNMTQHVNVTLSP